MPESLYKATEGIRAVKFNQHIYKLTEESLEVISSAFMVEQIEKRISQGQVTKEAFEHTIELQRKMNDYELVEWYVNFMINQIMEGNIQINDEDKIIKSMINVMQSNNIKYSQLSEEDRENLIFALINIGKRKYSDSEEYRDKQNGRTPYEEYIERWGLNNYSIKYGISLFEDGRIIGPYSFDGILQKMSEKGIMSKKIDEYVETLIYLDTRGVEKKPEYKYIIIITKGKNENGNPYTKRKLVIKGIKDSHTNNSFQKRSEFVRNFTDMQGLYKTIEAAKSEAILDERINLILDESTKKIIFGEVAEEESREQNEEQCLVVESVNENLVERYRATDTQENTIEFDHETFYPISDTKKPVKEVLEEYVYKNSKRQRYLILEKNSTKKEQIVIRKEKFIEIFRKWVSEIEDFLVWRNTSKREHGARYSRKIGESYTVQRSDKDALSVICAIFNSKEFKNLFKKSQVYLANNSKNAFGEENDIDVKMLTEAVRKVKGRTYEDIKGVKFEKSTFKIPTSFEELVPYFAMNISSEELRQILIITVNEFVKKNMYTNRGVHSILVALGQGYFQKITGGTISDVLQGIACGLGHDLGHTFFGHGGEKGIKCFEQEEAKRIFENDKIAIAKMALENPMNMSSQFNTLEKSTEIEEFYKILQNIPRNTKNEILDYLIIHGEEKSKRKFKKVDLQVLETIKKVYQEVINMPEERTNGIIEKYFVFSHAELSSSIIDEKIRSNISDGQTARICEIAALIHTSTDSLSDIEINQYIHHYPLNIQKILRFIIKADKFMTHSFDYEDMIKKGDIGSSFCNDIECFANNLEGKRPSAIATALDTTSTMCFDFETARIISKTEENRLLDANSEMKERIYSNIYNGNVSRPDVEIKKISKILCEKIYRETIKRQNLSKLTPWQLKEEFRIVNMKINRLDDFDGLCIIKVWNQLSNARKRVNTSVNDEEKMYWLEKIEVMEKRINSIINAKNILQSSIENQNVR